jgi:homoserine trans-succinylase
MSEQVAGANIVELAKIEMEDQKIAHVKRRILKLMAEKSRTEMEILLRGEQIVKIDEEIECVSGKSLDEAVDYLGGFYRQFEERACMTSGIITG